MQNSQERSNLRRIVLGFTAAALLCVGNGRRALAQAPHVVHASVAPAVETVHAGALARVVILARIANGYHVNAHKPTLDYAIPTRLVFDPSPVASFKSARYPAAKLVKFNFSEKPLAVYEGLFKVRAKLIIAASARAGRYRLQGVLRYQACNQESCLPPSSAPLTVTLRVVADRTASGSGKL